jgi:hypothetical protein
MSKSLDPSGQWVALFIGWYMYFATTEILADLYVHNALLDMGSLTQRHLIEAKK